MMITQEQAKIIASWWANQLCQPWQGSGDQQDKDWQQIKELGKKISHHIYDVPIPSEEQIRIFEAELALRLPAVMADCPKHDQSIGVDYFPDTILAQCLSMCGIHQYALPRKSGTQIYHGKVMAKRGYDGQWVEVEYPEYNHSLRIEDFSQFSLED